MTKKEYEESLRRRAIEHAINDHWDNDSNDTVKLAKKFVDFVREGEKKDGQ